MSGLGLVFELGLGSVTVSYCPSTFKTRSNSLGLFKINLMISFLKNASIDERMLNSFVILRIKCSLANYIIVSSRRCDS